MDKPYHRINFVKECKLSLSGMQPGNVHQPPLLRNLHSGLGAAWRCYAVEDISLPSTACHNMTRKEHLCPANVVHDLRTEGC